MWNKIFINAQNIEHETAKATLIKMPNKSNYAGYSFWHPSKLVRSEGGNGYHLSISFTNNFTFKLIKKGNGKWNRNETIDEIELSAEDFMNEFEIMSDNIELANERQEQKEKESYLIVREPDKFDKEIKVREELKNE
ncbi:MAG TPA: hypothetical protein GX708_11640 [Gallicola sp.]|nr:hypothetical protein [Gallicola sp.]